MQRPRLAFVGAGAVGGYVGGHLHRLGHDVTLIDPWPEHVEAIRARGLALDREVAPARGGAAHRRQGHDRARAREERPDPAPRTGVEAEPGNEDDEGLAAAVPGRAPPGVAHVRDE